MSALVLDGDSDRGSHLNAGGFSEEGEISGGWGQALGRQGETPKRGELAGSSACR